jgi:hypothetical protein
VIARATSAGLRSKKGLTLSPQGVGQMMRNPIYAGKVESPDYGVSTKGNFEPLVDEATFYRAQACSMAASWSPVRASGTIRISRCADSCAARRAVVRSPAAGRKGGTGTTPTTTARSSVAP